MTSGRAADWAEHFTETHMKTDENKKRYFDANMKWADFVLLLNRTFDVRRTKDKAKTDLAVLKHKSGNLKQYILDFNAMASRAGYFLPNDIENPVLLVLFLQGLNPALRRKITDQKDRPDKLKDIIDDARKFDQSYYETRTWDNIKTSVMDWKPKQQNRPAYSQKAHDPDAMDIDRLTIEERNEYMKKGKCFKCGQTGHMSRDHIINPELNKGNTSNYGKPATPYKAIMPPPGRNAAQRICALMMELDGKELEQAKIAFLETIGETSKIQELPEEEQDFQFED